MSDRLRPFATLRRRLGAAALAAVLGACTGLSPVEWSEFASIDPEGWDPLMSVEFVPEPSDSVAGWHTGCDVVLCLRYRAAAAPTRVPLEVLQENADADTLSCRVVDLVLADRYGRPTGHGEHGVYEVRDTLCRDIDMPEGYRVTCSLPQGAAAPRGLLDVGIVVTHAGATSRIPMPHIKL